MQPAGNGISDISDIQQHRVSFSGLGEDGSSLWLAKLLHAGVSAAPPASLLETIAASPTSPAAGGPPDTAPSRSDVLSSPPAPACAQLLREPALARRRCG